MEIVYVIASGQTGLLICPSVFGVAYLGNVPNPKGSVGPNFVLMLEIIVGSIH